MKKYAKVINEQTGLCEVGIGTDNAFYRSIGMTQKDVECSDIDGCWYLKAKCPMKTDEQKLQEAKTAKLDEATKKAYDFETTNAMVSVNATNLKTRSADIYHIEAHLTNLIKISAYAQSMAEGDILPWNTKENINIVLDKKGCALLADVMQKMNIVLWTEVFPQYVSAIEAAETAEDVEAILIDYDNPQEVLDIRIEGVTDENPTDEDSSDVPQESEDAELQTESNIQKKSSGEVE